MFVKQVKDFDCFSDEADVIVTDGMYELLCYCHPTENNILDRKVKEISSLFAENIMRSDSDKYLIRKTDNYYSYYLQGKVINKQDSIISIGKIIIELDKPLAKDINQGEFVELTVERLNCILEQE